MMHLEFKALFFTLKVALAHRKLSIVKVIDGENFSNKLFRKKATKWLRRSGIKKSKFIRSDDKSWTFIGYTLN